MSHPIPKHLLPTECMCEEYHGPRRADGVIEPCENPATMVATYDGTPIPLCVACLDAGHMGKEDA